MKSFQNRRSGVIAIFVGMCAAPLFAADPPVEPTVAVPATVSAFWTSDLNAKTSGYVKEVKHDIGDHVKKGDVLAEIYVPELEKNLASAKATLTAKQKLKNAADAAVAQAQQAFAVAQGQLEAYQADYYLADVTLKRQEELSAAKAATAQQLDDARSKAKVTAANVTIGQAKMNLAKADIQVAEANRDVAAAQVDVADAAAQEVQVLIDYTHITAPFDGVITRREINPGDLVQAAMANRTMPLFTLQQLDTMRVFCDVPEAQAAGVKIGATADVKVYGLASRVLTAKVTRLTEALDPTTRTMRVEVDLDNVAGVLRPGMYAQVTLKLQPPPSPATAAASSH